MSDDAVSRKAVLDALHTMLAYPTEACAIVRSVPAQPKGEVEAMRSTIIAELQAATDEMGFDLAGNDFAYCANRIIMALAPKEPIVSAAAEGVTNAGASLDCEGLVEKALHARVPGGAEVWCFLPQKDAFTPSETARAVIRAALEATNVTGVREELNLLHSAIEQSKWHEVQGERMKRILVAETAIERIRKALA